MWTEWDLAVIQSPTDRFFSSQHVWRRYLKLNKLCWNYGDAKAGFFTKHFRPKPWHKMAPGDCGISFDVKSKVRSWGHILSHTVCGSMLLVLWLIFASVRESLAGRFEIDGRWCKKFESLVKSSLVKQVCRIASRCGGQYYTNVMYEHVLHWSR